MNFDSPIGKKKITGTPMREFDVPDESGFSGANLPMENGEPVVRRRPVQQPLDMDGIREFQAKLQAETSPQFQDDPAEIERQIRQSRLEKRSGIERLSPGAKKRIEMLIGMTRSTRNADINGTEYTLQTLKSGEMRSALFEASQFDGSLEGPYEVRKQLLSRSLTHIAGVEIVQFIGSESLEMKLMFLDEMDELLINRLYEEYLGLVKEAKDKFSVKTEVEVKEVIEDLKK